MPLTPFESEVLESILWQVEGCKNGRVTERVTTRILRATIRRIKPRLIARSEAAENGKSVVDHTVPVHTLCKRILDTPDLDRTKLEEILQEWLVCAHLTEVEHTETLAKHNLQNSMPHDWDNKDPLARYKAAGIRFKDLRDEI